VVSFTPQPLYSREKAPGTHWIGVFWVSSRAFLDAVVKRILYYQLLVPVTLTYIENRAI
jgi:hypothetical protein